MDSVPASTATSTIQVQGRRDGTKMRNHHDRGEAFRRQEVAAEPQKSLKWAKTVFTMRDT